MANTVSAYAVIVLDPEGTITSWSSGAESLMGYAAEEAVGRRFSEFCAGEGRADPSALRNLDSATAEGQFEESGWLARKNGTPFFANSVISAVRDQAGALRGFTLVMCDTTERRHSDEMFRALLEAAPDALVIVNDRGEIILVNDQTEQIFGYQRSELQGQTVELLMPERYRRAHEGEREAYFRSPRTRPMTPGMVLFGRRKNGSEFPVEVSLSPLKTDEGVLVISAIRDITLRCQQEERLRQIEQLNSELVQSRALLELRNRQLSAANRELDEFAYIASHDLQEPLRKLLSFGKLLPVDIGGNLPEKAARDLRFITDAARRMQALIQDLLLLSRGGRAAMRKEEVPIDRCVTSALDALAVRIEESHAEIRRDALPVVQGDPTLLTQLYQNLAGNALKFCRPGTQPQIRFTAERAGDEIVLGVRDNGIGIKPEYAAMIFAPFKRLHRRDEYEGSGIGLALCRKVVERHGGRIWVESDQGQGSHFRFTLPSTQEKNNSWSDERASQPLFSS